MKSRDKEFYSLLEEGGWIERQIYSIWFDNDKLRKAKLIAAIDNKKIKFQVFKDGKTLLKKNILSPVEIIDSKDFLDRTKGLSGLNMPLGRLDSAVKTFEPFVSVGDMLSSPRKLLDYLLTPKNVSVDIELMLDARSLLAWLKCYHPLEQAEEDQGRIEKNTDFKKGQGAAQSQPDTPQARKKENNILKVIGGFVQTAYLKNKTGRYWNGDKPNISEIAKAFKVDLNTAGYSDEGFKERKLRDIISSSLEQIKENKTPER